ncbi:MAG: DUF1524 domain-containing protein [Deltaproteobacteria bacterium]|nr:DUF1524 domain-containing protein [Deltaproteobacteria bacterium]
MPIRSCMGCASSSVSPSCIAGPYSRCFACTRLTDEEIETLTYRLGNLTLLGTAANHTVGNNSFVDQCEIYRAKDDISCRNTSKNRYSPRT